MSDIIVLYEGYSVMSGNEDEMTANCSCTLIKGRHNVIVDTMTAWDSEKILSSLRKHNITPEEINYVVSTHGHSDHVGNNNLFLNAKHIVGFSVSHKDKYIMHPFDKGIYFPTYLKYYCCVTMCYDTIPSVMAGASAEEQVKVPKADAPAITEGEAFLINDNVKVVPTPGHTMSDVTVLAKTVQGHIIALTGDLFEKYEDIENPKIWLEAGSEDPVQQAKNRLKVVEMADWIVPGHGTKFQVTKEIRQILRKQSGDASS